LHRIIIWCSAQKVKEADFAQPKPSGEDILAALTAAGEANPKPPENPMTAGRVRWEDIQRIYELCNRNVSETARRLHVQRRTLQRLLAKRAPK
jgi:two-component system, response regulator RegA